MNWRLAGILFALVFVVVAGSVMTAALAMGYTDSTAMVATLVLGFLVSVPATIVVTKQLQEFIKTVPH
ncbi:hypothetical protein EV700_1078 [Fluviicoccus keumensis]|uniref:CTP synthetase n=1 Tax=Fluviicoccus keumensis TaxID=1435465 RepID=A0A4Q7ZDJ4_9GAMM|nr:CTP synthetase [Fluviicoccus keumensis]RZU48105.1 hypothetical protein EV700_1078 [Fluviicoccus keumensis]